MEGITQLLESNFEQSKCKWRHKYHTFAKKGTFFLTCPNPKTRVLINGESGSNIYFCHFDFLKIHYISSDLDNYINAKIQ